MLVQGNKGVFQALSYPGQPGQGYERTFSASAAFRACVLSDSATAKWSLLVACHLRVAISCMCLVVCQPLVRQTLVREPLCHELVFKYKQGFKMEHANLGFTNSFRRRVVLFCASWPSWHLERNWVAIKDHIAPPSIFGSKMAPGAEWAEEAR